MSEKIRKEARWTLRAEKTILTIESACKIHNGGRAKHKMFSFVSAINGKLQIHQGSTMPLFNHVATREKLDDLDAKSTNSSGIRDHAYQAGGCANSISRSRYWRTVMNEQGEQSMQEFAVPLEDTNSAENVVINETEGESFTQDSFPHRIQLRGIDGIHQSLQNSRNLNTVIPKGNSMMQDMPLITDGILLAPDTIAPLRVEAFNRTLPPIKCVTVATTYLHSPKDNLGCVSVVNYRAQEEGREGPVTGEFRPPRKRKAFMIDDKRSRLSKQRKKVKTWPGQQERQKSRRAVTEMTYFMSWTLSVAESSRQCNDEFAQVKLADLSCLECGILFVQRSSVAQHMRAVHMSERKFSCQYKGCTRTYKASGDLTRHIKCVHLQERPFDCHICGEKFTRSHSLKRHVRNIHAS